MVAAGLPFGGMLHLPRPNHVEVDLDQAAGQMPARLNRGGVVAILPEGPPASLSLVVPLPRLAGDELQAAGYLAPRSVADQEMNKVVTIGAWHAFSWRPHFRPEKGLPSPRKAPIQSESQAFPVSSSGPTPRMNQRSNTFVAMFTQTPWKASGASSS